MAFMQYSRALWRKSRMASTCISKVFPGKFLVLAGCLVALTGCASGPKTYEIRGEAAPLINRDASGNPLSVVVHIYQLRDAEEFSKLTFDTLASGRPVADLLGKDLLEQNEVTLVPGATYASTAALKEETKLLGVVAFFRQPDQHYWRFLVDAVGVRKNGLHFRVQDCFLAIEGNKPNRIPGQPENAFPVCGNAGQRTANLSQSAVAVPARKDAAHIRKRAGMPDDISQGRAASP
jgi:type VI secretion system protein VasD